MPCAPSAIPSIVASIAAPTRFAEFPVVRGTITRAKGHLGAFELGVDGFAQALPSSRRVLEFGIKNLGDWEKLEVLDPGAAYLGMQIEALRQPSLSREKTFNA